jgi:predicted ATP-dependent protease
MHCSHLLRNEAVIIFLFSIIIPYANIKDLEKIDESLRKRAQFYPVRDIKEALAVAFPGLI